MGSPTIFSGKFTKLLTQNGVLTQAGAVLENDGAKNYLPKGNAESTNPFVMYADGASATPVDGTGGSPSAVISISSSSPLSGSKSFVFTSGSQGDGGAYSFTIDSQDKSSVQTLIISTDGAFAQNDLSVWLYDVTNSQLIYAQPTQYLSNAAGKQKVFFQLTTGTSYRFLIHQSSANSFTAKFEMSLSAMPFAGYAPIFTEPKSFDTSVGTWLKAVTTDPTSYGTIVRNEGRVSQQGGKLNYTWQFEQSSAGTGGSGTYLLRLPNKIDLTKYGLAQNYVDTSFNLEVSPEGGFFAYYNNGSDSGFAAKLYIYDESTLYVAIKANSGTYNYWSSTFFEITAANTMSYSMWANLWTLGLSAQTQVISEYDGRVVAAIYEAAIGTAITVNTPFQWNTKQIDTHSAVTTGAGWRFTAPVAGIYRVSFVMYLAGANTDICLYKNGSLKKVMAYSGAANELVPVGSTLIELNIGDYVDLRPTNVGATITDVGTGSSAKQCITIDLLSGAQQITAGERIYADYSTNAGQSIPNATVTIVDFEDKTEDSHSSVTTGASFKFTAQRNDLYTVSACIQASAANYTNIDLELRIYKNGVFYRSLGKFNREAYGQNVDPTICGTLKLKLNVGDYIDARAYQANGGSINLSTASEYNWFQVTSGVA